MSNSNILKIGSIIFTIGAVILLILSILGNDKLITLSILFALVSTMLSAKDKSSKSNELTVPEKSKNKILIWISVLIIIAGIIFAIIV